MEHYKDIDWTPIPGYDGYFISEDGKILSKKFKNPKILTHQFSNAQKDKQPSITLTINKKAKKLRVVFLVALTFIDNPNQYNLIKYKDGNILNIHRNNLEWSDNPFDSEENWEVVKNFPNYEICEKGVRNINTKIMLIPSITVSGYPYHHLVKTVNDKELVYLHVLMAKQYIPNPLNLPEVNHINGDKMDFSSKNLEWVTEKQNSQHAHDTGLIPSKRKGKQVELLNENNEVIKIFSSIKETSDFVGESRDKIKNKLIESNDGTTLINGYMIRLKLYENLENEIWKNVNTENLKINERYEVSNFGRVKMIGTTRILTADIKEVITE